MSKFCRGCTQSIIKGGVGRSFDKNGSTLCKDCNKYLPVSAFYKNSTSKSTLCKLCSHKRAARYNKTIYRYKKYGITEEFFSNMLQSQNNACAICNRDFIGGTDIKIDHDHKTGQVRGLLCHNCNTGLGHFKDNIKIFQSTIKYLENGIK